MRRKMKCWLSLPAGHAGGEDDASDSALPSFSLDRGETQKDAGNKREGQKETKCRHQQLVASERAKQGERRQRTQKGGEKSPCVAFLCLSWKDSFILVSQRAVDSPKH